ncbi:hypothetical protein SDC9_195934 [bioreactor metagenome]|uniref:Uncharacterized protein n=1 Tax=bioreactor metagenome TaxID=1076179 RepID=A0A645IAH5_9ZZZZ
MRSSLIAMSFAPRPASVIGGELRHQHPMRIGQCGDQVRRARFATARQIAGHDGIASLITEQFGHQCQHPGVAQTVVRQLLFGRPGRSLPPDLGADSVTDGGGCVRSGGHSPIVGPCACSNAAAKPSKSVCRSSPSLPPRCPTLRAPMREDAAASPTNATTCCR